MRNPTAACLAGLLLVGACGGDDEPARPEFTQDDVAFVTYMTQHHERTLSMVALTRDRPVDPGIRRIAADMEGVRTVELETMTAWLTTHDEPVPAESPDVSPYGADDPDIDNGAQMVSTDELAELARLPDRRFQQRWLREMIEHNDAAVQLARGERSEVDYTPVYQLADSIEANQDLETVRLRALTSG